MDLTSINLAAMSINRPLSTESIAYSTYAMSTITKSSILNPATITPAYLILSKSPKTWYLILPTPNISYATGAYSGHMT